MSKEKEEILSVANDLFMERGPGEVGLNDIAEKAGMDLTTVESLYPNVMAIINDLLVEELETSSELFTKVMNDRGKADIKLSRLVKELLVRYKKSYTIQKLINNSGDPTDVDTAFYSKTIKPEHVERYRQNIAILARLIAQGQSENLFVDNIDPLEAAYLLRGMISSSVKYQNLLMEKGEEAKDTAEVIIRIFLKGLLR